mmetsp:Transcript_32543/g.45431  ORF Transcript_32543/g.45431 Transcript_32543/m.45431 type:complete len:238 (+) Transcript_32543:172-885(+)
MEVYATRKFFIITGRFVPNCPGAPAETNHSDFSCRVFFEVRPNSIHIWLPFLRSPILEELHFFFWFLREIASMEEIGHDYIVSLSCKFIAYSLVPSRLKPEHIRYNDHSSFLTCAYIVIVQLSQLSFFPLGFVVARWQKCTPIRRAAAWGCDYMNVLAENLEVRSKEEGVGHCFIAHPLAAPTKEDHTALLVNIVDRRFQSRIILQHTPELFEEFLCAFGTFKDFLILSCCVKDRDD